MQKNNFNQNDMARKMNVSRGHINQVLNGNFNFTLKPLMVERTGKANNLRQAKLFNSVFFANANTGYAVGNGGTIIKTTNGGNSFTGINLNLKVIPEGIIIHCLIYWEGKTL